MSNKQVLFELKNHVKFLSADELSEILNDDVLSIEDKKDHFTIRFSGNRDLTILNSGSKFWYLNNSLHRVNDQPAAINSDGSKSWWIKGKLIKKS